MRSADAAVFVGCDRGLEVRSLPVLPPSDGRAVVDLVASGVCGTDVHILDGAIGIPPPFIPGHEFLGRVSGLGDGPHVDCLGRPVKPGDLVAVNVIEPCGSCLLCGTGGAASCLNLMASLSYIADPDVAPHLHGGYAEATNCPTGYLQLLPPDLDPMVASAFLCAGPTVVRAMAYAGGVRSGQHVVVIGSGPVGLFGVLWAARHGAVSVTMIGSSSSPLRLELARALGATATLDIRASTAADRLDAVRAVTGGLGADLVLEGAGAPDAFAEGLSLLRPRGRLALAGQYSDRGAASIAPNLLTCNALQVFGSAQFTAEDREACFEFLLSVRDAWPTIHHLVTHRAAVRDAASLIEIVRSGKAIKALLVAGG
jgi:5-exo-hydroxycamphor dehydrogenase